MPYAEKNTKNRSRSLFIIDMSIIDIVILGIIGLGLIIGLIKGFPLKKLNFAFFIISAGAAYMACGPLGRYLMDTSFGYETVQGMYFNLLPTTSSFTDAVSTDEAVMMSQFKVALTELKIPGFFQGMFTSRVLDNTSDIATALASSFAFLTLVASAFVIIFLLAFLLLRVILSPIWKMLFGSDDKNNDGKKKNDGKGFLGRVFGLLLGGSKAIFIVLVVFILASLVDQLSLKMGNDVIHNWLNDQLKLDDSSIFTVGKYFYQTASSLLSWISQQ